MADITDSNATLPVRVVGSDSVGQETTPVASTPGGGVHANLRDSEGVEFKGQQLGQNSIPVVPSQEASFVVCAEATQIANNKSMISLMNSVESGVIVKIRRIFLINVRTAAVTGVVGEFQIKRISGHSAGTEITPDPYDTNDILDAGVSARTGAVVTGEASRNLRRALWSTDEWGVGSEDVESMDHAYQSLTPLYEHQAGTKPITLRPGQGLHVKQRVNSSNGTFDLVIEFTQEI